MEVTQASSKTARRARNSQQMLLSLVRGACETLLSAHPSVVESLTVSRTLDDADSARLAARMATRVAEEYGLDIETRVDAKTVTVRLSRDGDFIRLKRDRSRNGHRAR
jgi:hypothetical protein